MPIYATFPSPFLLDDQAIFTMDVTSLEWIKSSKQLLGLPPEVFLQIVEQLPPENAALLALTTKCLYHEPRLQRL